MKFTLEIELGNDAMQDGFQIAEALHMTAGKLEQMHLDHEAIQAGTVIDLNGNTVGQWKIEE